MQNPFRDTVAEAWGEPLDLQSLNASASDELVRRIDGLARESRGAGPPPRSQCVLLLGPAGSGKTHLFARLRKKLGYRAVFFHTRPELGAPATPRYLLAQLVDALRFPASSSEHTQLDLIAGAMLSVVEGHPTKYPLTMVAQPHDDPRRLVERGLAAAERRYPQLLPKYLERLLQAPFEPEVQTRRAMYAWLSGRPPSEAELARLGEAQGLGDEDVLPALRTLGFAATFGAPLVLVFDQLENLADDDPARTRMMAHAQLISELHDTVPGTLIVQMALDSEWTRFIRPALPPQLRHRVEDTVVPLGFPAPEQARQLVELHLNRIPAEERKGAFPWPLDPAAVKRWTEETMTPRALIQRCKSAFDDFLAGKVAAAGGAPQPADGTGLDQRLEVLWADFVEKARTEIDRAARDGHYLDAERMASGLLTILPLVGAPARRVPGKKNRPDIRVTTSQVSLVLLAQQNHHRSLGALLAEATQIEADRMIIVREHAFAIPPTWKQVHAQLKALRDKSNIVYTTVGRDELIEWLAAESVLSAARSKDLSDEQGHTIEHGVVLDWLERRYRRRRSGFPDVFVGPPPEPSSDEGGPDVAVPPKHPAHGAAPSARSSQQPKQNAERPATNDSSSTPKPPATESKSDTQPRGSVRPEASEAEALEKIVLNQLLKLGVTATVTRRVAGARLIRLEVSSPRQRVADLDRAAADVEHKLADHQVRFEREGPRRFFSAPRSNPRPVLLDDLIKKEETWLRERPGRFVLGERVDGEVVRGDLSDGGSCHLLIAGQTGSGKSVLLRALVLSLARLHPASRIRFTLGDPKRVTFGALVESLGDHVALPIAYDAEAIVARLEKLAEQMDLRFTSFQKGRVQDIHEHNALAVEKLPLEIIVIDEFADLVLDKAYKQPFLEAVKRIGNMGRAAGIHMLLATQRPDRNTVPGEVKANLVGKVALKVQSALNSRIILDEGGAEKLLGRGDLLVDIGHGIVRAQAPGS
ncbi:FtsK/SpoIIIE domain-containing protein [Sorangium sp. So ce204]|uniref:FtsK/SpoIIIE domain-containing protein n=1 Tax=Sorangium sp. So ce204 TaxID=3133288 RepID=UPI003F5DDC41